MILSPRVNRLAKVNIQLINIFNKVNFHMV